MSPATAADTALDMVLYPGSAHDVPGGVKPTVGVVATHRVVGSAKTATGVATCKTTSNDVMTSMVAKADSILFDFIKIFKTSMHVGHLPFAS